MQLSNGLGKVGKNREQWKEYLRSGCGGRGGGYDRDLVVEAGGGLTRWDLRADVRDECSSYTMGVEILSSPEQLP